MSARAGTLRRVAIVALLSSVLAACGSDGSQSPAATGPQLLMTGATSGLAVWPSGARWILLATADGWRTVANRTPPAVPTDGGLVVAARGRVVVAGVLPHELLTVSPVLESVDAGRHWTPSQLPAALLGTPTSLARSAGATWAVLAGGAVVVHPDGTTGWREVTSAATLDPTGALRLTGVDFPDGTTGFVTGSTDVGGPLAFVSADQGSAWRPVAIRGPEGSPATAVQVCRFGAVWAVPVVSGLTVRVYTASNPDGHWTAGDAVDVGTSQPVVACGRDAVVVALPLGSVDALVVSSPEGGWQRLGELDRHVAGMTVSPDGQTLVATRDPVALVSVRLEQGLPAAAVPLPAWVATVGGGSMRD